MGYAGTKINAPPEAYFAGEETQSFPLLSRVPWRNQVKSENEKALRKTRIYP